MPPQEYWEELLDAGDVLDRLGFCSAAHARTLELGCGYGTFTVPAARCRGAQRVHTFDLDGDMALRTSARAAEEGVSHIVRTEVRDVVANGYGVADGTYDAAMLFNILHCEDPVGMMRQAALALSPGGSLYAAHWRHDPATPRGPPMSMRPRPEQLREWALETGLLTVGRGPVDLPPWHYGWVFSRVDAQGQE